MPSPRPIVDERTLAGYLIGPTEQRARERLLRSVPMLIRYADVEEHAVDPESGITRRCDLTLRSDLLPLVSAEMKRPEVMGVDDPALVADAYRKAVQRGMAYFMTCNVREVAVWRTADGVRQLTPFRKVDLAPQLSESYYAQARRQEIGDNWMAFLDQLEPLLAAEADAGRPAVRPLPAHARELRDAINNAAQEAAVRIREALDDDVFRDDVLTAFRDQFGVELQLDVNGPPDQFRAESEQVAAIASFVVASRLLLYQALSAATLAGGVSFGLDPLEVTRSATDPQRVSDDISNLLAHAHRRTQDFESTLTPSDIDRIVFVSGTSRGDVGRRWGQVVDVIRQHDWSGPSDYVPGLYESLLDDEHRHVMGVHYTPEALAEVLAAYAVRDGADVVLDPACGGGTFLTMGYQRKVALGSTHEQALDEVYGVELADFAASLSSLVLALADPSAGSAYPRVVQSDFFRYLPGAATGVRLPRIGDLHAPTEVDAVIGNPPYVRFELRSPSERREVHDLLAAAYNRDELAFPDFTGKADLWAYFIAHATQFLAPGGRLALVLSWNLLSTVYGDAVLSFLGRYFEVDAIIDSRVERWFAAKQNTLLLLARRAPTPSNIRNSQPNPSIGPDHMVRFVRLKRPIERLLDMQQPKGKRAEDLLDDLLSLTADAADDLRWDARLVPQRDLVARTSTVTTDDSEDEDASEHDE